MTFNRFLYNNEANRNQLWYGCSKKKMLEKPFFFWYLLNHFHGVNYVMKGKCFYEVVLKNVKECRFFFTLVILIKFYERNVLTVHPNKVDKQNVIGYKIIPQTLEFYTLVWSLKKI